MPAEYCIDPKNRVVLSRGTGTFTYADYLAHIGAVGTDPAFSSAYGHLIECRRFLAIEISGAQMLDLSTRSVFAASSRRAFVVADPAEYGLARMLALYRESAGMKNTVAVHSMEEALSWLGLPAGYRCEDLSGWQTVLSPQRKRESGEAYGGRGAERP